MDVIDRVPGLPVSAARVRQHLADVRTRHHGRIREHGTDLPEIAQWRWEGRVTARSALDLNTPTESPTWRRRRWTSDHYFPWLAEQDH